MEKTVEIRRDGTIIGIFGRPLKPIVVDDYLYVTINNRHKSIHRLVAETFIPNPLGLPQVNHKDGDKTNNNDWNLEWCTAKENTQHGFKTGLMNNHHLRKLTNVQVEEIRKLDGKIPHREIGEIYSIARQTVDKIIKNQTYVKKL